MSYILVVDDQETLRFVLQEFLTEMGHRVQVAPDGRAALGELNGAQQPDLIILDLFMPVMGGRELLRIIRRTRETEGIPVILITGSEHSVNHFPPPETYQAMINKPFDLGELKDKVTEILAQVS